jgi:hypothetical protein
MIADRYSASVHFPSASCSTSCTECEGAGDRPSFAAVLLRGYPFRASAARSLAWVSGDDSWGTIADAAGIAIVQRAGWFAAYEGIVPHDLIEQVQGPDGGTRVREQMRSPSCGSWRRTPAPAVSTR